MLSTEDFEAVDEMIEELARLVNDESNIEAHTNDLGLDQEAFVFWMMKNLPAIVRSARSESVFLTFMAIYQHGVMFGMYLEKRKQASGNND